MADAAPKPTALPQRIRLLKWGVNPSTEGDVIVDERTLAAFDATQRRYGREEAPLDFEHNTVPGTPEYERSQEPRPVAANGRPVVIRGEGVFLDNLTWTTTGAASHDNYVDVSAAPWLNQERVVMGLHSGALCRAGAVYGAHKTAALSADAAKDADDYTLTFFSTGLRPASLSAAPCAAAIEPATSKPIMPEPLTVEVLSAQLTAALKPIQDRLAALEAAPKPDLAAFSARVEKLETAEINAERLRLLPLFAQQGQCPQNPATGKSYTADELAALDLPTLRVLHANTPRTVPTTASPKAGEPTEPALKGLARVAAAINEQIQAK